MSEIKGRVGKYSLNWKSIPRGHSGSAHVEVKAGSIIEVRWRRDGHGIWIELPHGTFGFDLEGELSDDSRMVYSVSQRESAREWKNLVFTRAGEENVVGAASTAKR